MKALLLLSLLFFSAQSMADVVVIVNAANTNTLTKDDVERIFLGKKTSFPDGSKAQPFYLSPGDGAKEVFDEKSLGKSSAQLKAYWSKLVFTGKGTPPEEVGSSADAVSKVAGDATAVAYIDRAALNDKVKIAYVVE